MVVPELAERPGASIIWRRSSPLAAMRCPSTVAGSTPIESTEDAVEERHRLSQRIVARRGHRNVGARARGRDSTQREAAFDPGAHDSGLDAPVRLEAARARLE